ncbi:MAG TPA: hypothetical protein VGR96_05905 [Acidobacteriaceae bacterium]|nr:hypothetical protein [Acidobacteriaceae bacterium]
MTNDIFRLSDALTRDNQDSRLREQLTQDSGKIRESLNSSGVYRFRTPQGTIVIRSARKRP